MNDYSFILASTSPRRREMLERAGFFFEVVAPPDDDNSRMAELSPTTLVADQALAKGRAVASARPEEYVLAADTVVVLYGRVMGKPADEAEARVMLTDLAGRVHEVLTGFCLLRGEEIISREVVRTKVEFRGLGSAEIEAYTATGSPLDKAGAYGIQDLGGGLVRAIEGSYTNVVGLPLAQVIEALARVGVHPGRPGGRDK